MTHKLIRAMVAAQGDRFELSRATTDAVFAAEPALPVDAADAPVVLAMLAKAAALGNEIPIMRRIVSRIIVTYPVSSQEPPGTAGDRVRAEIARVAEKPHGEAPAQPSEPSPHLTARQVRPAPRPSASEQAERERERKERGEGAGEGAVESIGAGAQRWQPPTWQNPDHEICGCGGVPGDPRPGHVCARHAGR